MPRLSKVHIELLSQLLYDQKFELDDEPQIIRHMDIFYVI